MNMIMPHALLRLLILPALALALGCGGADSEEDAPNLEQAWSDFEAGQAPEAISSFLDALGSHPRSAEAWCGLGWSRAAWIATGQAVGDQREGVLQAFHQADLLHPGYVDALAGLAEFHSAANDTTLALEWALDAAAHGGVDYVFAHRETVSHRSMRKIAAWNLFKLQRYAEAAQQVRHILPEFQYSAGSDSLDLLLEGIGQL